MQPKQLPSVRGGGGCSCEIAGVGRSCYSASKEAEEAVVECCQPSASAIGASAAANWSAGVEGDGALRAAARQTAMATKQPNQIAAAKGIKSAIGISSP